ncbi:MAG: 50S ribosomal protein L1 [Gammaproteobacteria bacterium]|nr:50S ribosomal protein L1 [Gammaproteobacteria bacterium]
MAKLSKRQQLIAKELTHGKVYAIEQALEILKKTSKVKFDETVDVAIILGIDTKKSDQTVRSAVVLPNGTGKTVRIAVFAQGKNAELALAAGADRVGMEDLAEDMKKGNMPYDVVIASPDTMRVVGQLGQVLGPRGLMPNPKVGTVTPDVAGAVKNAKAGQVRYRADKAGIVHSSIGKASFTVEALKQNLEALLTDVKRMKPNSAKGIYLKKISVSSTMGAGLVVDMSSIAA